MIIYLPDPPELQLWGIFILVEDGLKDRSSYWHDG